MRQEYAVQKAPKHITKLQETNMQKHVAELDNLQKCPLCKRWQHHSASCIVVFLPKLMLAKLLVLRAFARAANTDRIKKILLTASPVRPELCASMRPHPDLPAHQTANLFCSPQL